MLTVYWSCKGGVGTTVVAALCALRSAETHSTIAVGLDGDLAAALGVSIGSDDAGFGDWTAAACDGATTDGLVRVGVEAAPGLTVVSVGQPPPTDLDEAVGKLVSGSHHVIVDAGRIDLQPLSVALARAATASLFVTRRCYLALRRANELPVQPTGVVVVSERGRALTLADVEAVTGAPVVADLAVDDALARTVDAGLLTTRLPRGVLASLDHVA